MSRDSNQISFDFKDYKTMILYLVIKEQKITTKENIQKKKVFSLKRNL